MISLLNIFHVAFWLAIFFTLFLASFTLWCLGVRTADSTSFKKITLCFYNTWAMLLGVSATAMPVTPTLRIVSLLYVCYSLCINTVFQGYFVTHLAMVRSYKPWKTFNVPEFLWVFLMIFQCIFFSPMIWNFWTYIPLHV